MKKEKKESEILCSVRMLCHLFLVMRVKEFHPLFWKNRSFSKRVLLFGKKKQREWWPFLTTWNGNGCCVITQHATFYVKLGHIKKVTVGQNHNAPRFGLYTNAEIIKITT